MENTSIQVQQSEDISYTGVEKEQAKDIPVNPQEKKDQDISHRIWVNFDKWRNNRNRSFSYFRERNIYQYINDNNLRFNNYKVKPAWKEEWQANISDITTHAKLMAIIANVVSSNYKPEFTPKRAADIFSMIKATLLGDLYNYTETEVRRGKMDLLFATLKAAREGTVIGFEGWKKTKLYEGIDAQIIPLEDFYPCDMQKFHMADIHRCVWRSVITEDDWRDGFQSWYQYDKVKIKQNIGAEERTFFNISDDVDTNQVELIRYFDELNDEYFVTANGILIITPGTKEAKLSARRKKGGMGFWKMIYEVLDDNFFYGRAFPDLLKDNQDSIDFLFNNMFDKALISTLRPLLVGGVNQLTSDYLYPMRPIQVADVTQVRELDIQGPDRTSFSILQELQNRNVIASVDSTSSGIASGNKTATEVERAQENARKIYSLFGLMIADGIEQKAKLRTGTIIQYMLKSKAYKNLVLKNTQLLFDQGIGTKVIKIKPFDQLSARNDMGYSPQLEQENNMIPGPSQVWEFASEDFQDIEVDVSVNVASVVEMSQSLKRAFLDRFTQKAYIMPQIFNPEMVAQIDVENNKDILGPHAKDILVKPKQQGQSGQPGQSGQIPGSEFMNEMTPTAKTAVPNQEGVPSLKEMLNAPA